MSFATSYERYFVSLVNQARAANGLQPLRIEKHLNDSSDRHSAWMLEADVFSHTGAGGSSSRQRMESAGFDLSGRWRTAENIAYVSVQGESDLRDEIRQLHKNLMDSPGHYRNIMSDVAYIGIGLEVGYFRHSGRDYKVLMATQNFADTNGQVSIDTGTFLRATLPRVDLTLPTKQEWMRTFNGEVYTTPGPAQFTARNDDFRLTARNDVANGGAGNDWMLGNGGNDRLNGGAGHDRLSGGAGADVLIGGLGHDTLQGDLGNDTLNGDLGNDLLLGGAGHDVILGGAGDDRVLGGIGNDRINGGHGHDLLRGDAGNDTISGDAGNDTIIGGAGNDTLSGGAGADVFVFQSGHGRDVINAYEVGVDRLFIGRGLLGNSAPDFIDNHMRQTNSGVVIDFGTHGSITLNGRGLTVAAVADDIFAL